MTGPLTIPDDLLYLVTTDRVGAVSWARTDGTVVSHLMWIDWDGEHLLTSSPIGSIKGQHARRNGQVSVVAVDRDDPWRFVNMRGRVTDIVPDENLEFIDKMSVRYTGQPYYRRGFEREIFVITPDHVSLGRGGRARKPST
jgi:PPOX class probable F420-dependent enzyme